MTHIPLELAQQSLREKQNTLFYANLCIYISQVVAEYTDYWRDYEQMKAVGLGCTVAGTTFNL